MHLDLMRINSEFVSNEMDECELQSKNMNNQKNEHDKEL
jgi:hypothetical protein